MLLPQGCNELNARRMAVLETVRASSLRRHVHRAFLRSVWLDLPSIRAATTCHQSNDAERYSRYRHVSRKKVCLNRCSAAKEVKE